MSIVENQTFTTLPFTMIYVKGGSFEMGSEEYDYEKPIHTVNVQDFWIGEFPVTQALWKAVMGNNPSNFVGERNPVECVSWDDICTGEYCFLNKLNVLLEKELAAKGFKGFCLPSEAQWEYAARGGSSASLLTADKGCRYVGSNLIEEVAWYSENSHGSTMPVGMKKPNELGIYDMSGNVWEWCADHWHDNYGSAGSPTAPNDGSIWTNQNSNITRNEESYWVLRGGSWFSYDLNVRISSRDRYYTVNRNNNIGFRLVLFR